MQATAGALRREVQVVGLVSFAHLLSHVYMFALVPLYPQITKSLGIGFTEIGIAATVLAAFTGGFQTPMGFLVDRVGGRNVLIGGLLINAAAIGLIGFATSYWQLLALMALAGLGSSVFHPADYSILSATAEENRLGRVFSMHTMGGQIGSASAVPLVVALAYLFEWRHALMVVGGVGVALALVMLAMSRVIGAGGQTKKKEKDKGPSAWRRLATSPVIMMFFVFYVGSSAGNAGIIQFSVTAYGTMYGLPLVATAIALTVYQVMTLLMVLPGGVLADRVKAPEMVLGVCFGAGALMVVIAGLGTLPFWLAVCVLGIAGGLRGLVNSSRDVSVRHAAGEGISVATVFAFVSTGFSLGQMLGPALYGWLIDHGAPQSIFWVSAGFSVLSLTAMVIGQLIKPRAATQPAE